MVSIVQVLPYVDSLVPAIKVKVEESIPSNTVLFKIDGVVMSSDCKFISRLIDLPSETNIQRTEVIDLARGAYRKIVTSKDLIFTLDKSVIDYIEELRYNHPNGSVVLRFELNVVLLLHELRLGGFKPHNRPNLQR